MIKRGNDGVIRTVTHAVEFLMFSVKIIQAQVEAYVCFRGSNSLLYWFSFYIGSNWIESTA